MEKGIYVKEIEANTSVGGLFVILSAKSGVTTKGDNFWALKLSDRTGVMDAKIWSPLSASFASLDSGVVASVRGWASLYRDQLQLRVDFLEPLTDEETGKLDPACFIQASPRNPDEMFKELKQLCLDEFKYAPLRKLVMSVLNEETIARPLRSFPAAKTMHHAYAAGLLEHTLGVFSLCRSLADRYPQLDRQILLAGALFHDIGKIKEFSGGFINDYTDAGRLSGHIILGLRLIEPYLQKSGVEEALLEHLRHLILSHHGEYEYGASRLPQTAEAFALHYADNLDAKLAQFRNLFGDEGEPGWSDYQKGLERYLYNPFRAPRKSKTQKNGPDAECLSLLKE